jgi:hypothetical protein
MPLSIMTNVGSKGIRNYLVFRSLPVVYRYEDYFGEIWGIFAEVTYRYVDVLSDSRPTGIFEAEATSIPLFAEVFTEVADDAHDSTRFLPSSGARRHRTSPSNGTTLGTASFMINSTT